MTDENKNETTTDDTDAQLGEPGKKALQEERRARREAEKSLRDAQARISELEKADVVRDVAAEKGLTAEQARRLIGETREELAADADALLESFGSDDKARPPGNRQERLRGGADPTADPEPNVAAVADEILGSF